MPSHPDRVRKFNCPEHSWIAIFGVYRVSTFTFALDPYECVNCGAIISQAEYNKLVSEKNDLSRSV